MHIILFGYNLLEVMYKF